MTVIVIYIRSNEKKRTYKDEARIYTYTKINDRNKGWYERDRIYEIRI